MDDYILLLTNLWDRMHNLVHLHQTKYEEKINIVDTSFSQFDIVTSEAGLLA